MQLWRVGHLLGGYRTAVVPTMAGTGDRAITAGGAQRLKRQSLQLRALPGGVLPGTDGVVVDPRLKGDSSDKLSLCSRGAEVRCGTGKATVARPRH